MGVGGITLTSDPTPTYGYYVQYADHLPRRRAGRAGEQRWHPPCRVPFPRAVDARGALQPRHGCQRVRAVRSHAGKHTANYFSHV